MVIYKKKSKDLNESLKKKNIKIFKYECPVNMSVHRRELSCVLQYFNTKL